MHDAGDYFAPLPAGAVITVEPGIYLPDRGLGVRIEDELVLAVRDDGHGMPEAVQKRALEPFFTTRTAGEAGLGLAIAASIVEAHGG
ncbi:MAG TPA: ATP-binding protein, partial [Kofleriaceae bacterium]